MSTDPSLVLSEDTITAILKELSWLLDENVYEMIVTDTKQIQTLAMNLQHDDEGFQQTLRHSRSQGIVNDDIVQRICDQLVSTYMDSIPDEDENKQNTANKNVKRTIRQQRTFQPIHNTRSRSKSRSRFRSKSRSRSPSQSRSQSQFQFQSQSQSQSLPIDANMSQQSKSRGSQRSRGSRRRRSKSARGVNEYVNPNKY